MIFDLSEISQIILIFLLSHISYKMLGGGNVIDGAGEEILPAIFPALDKSGYQSFKRSITTSIRPQYTAELLTLTSELNNVFYITYLALKSFVLWYYDNNRGEVMEISLVFVKQLCRALCVAGIPSSAGRPNLATTRAARNIIDLFLEAHPHFIQRAKPFTTYHRSHIIDYNIKTIFTNYNNNIKKNFKSWLYR